MKPRLKRRAGRPAGQRRAVRKGRGAPAPPNHPQPPTWRAWKAQNGGKRWYWRAPLAIEWGLEWFVHWLRSLALFDLLELAGRLVLLFGIVSWVLEADQRARQAEEAIKARHYRAWELINSARGLTGDGGRKDALQDLNKDRVSLAGAPLEHAYLRGVDLKGADLLGANLQGADLAIASLSGANLPFANLQDANLQDANLQDANLQGANLTQEQLDLADGNDQTELPEGLTRPADWIKNDENEPWPALLLQPDDGGRAPAADGAPSSAK